MSRPWNPAPLVVTCPVPADGFSTFAPPGQVADGRLVVLCAVADETGLLDALPGPPDDVAARSGLEPGAARVVLDALAAWGVVERDGGGAYRVGPAAPSAEDLPAISHHARSIRQTAAVLPDRLRGTGTEELGLPPDLERWQDVMAAAARDVAPALVDACLARTPGARRVLDLGGGHGEYGLEFARRGMAVTLQDQTPVIEMHRRRGGVEAAGVELFDGDFFEVLPEGPFDVVWCAGVTHTFDGQCNRLLYRRLGPLVSPDGAIAIFTFLRGQAPEAALFAIQMLVVGRGGDTHGEAEYRQWLEEAGFSMEVAEVVDGRSLLHARRR